MPTTPLLFIAADYAFDVADYDADILPLSLFFTLRYALISLSLFRFSLFARLMLMPWLDFSPPYCRCLFRFSLWLLSLPITAIAAAFRRLRFAIRHYGCRRLMPPDYAICRHWFILDCWLLPPLRRLRCHYAITPMFAWFTMPFVFSYSWCHFAFFLRRWLFLFDGSLSLRWCHFFHDVFFFHWCCRFDTPCFRLFHISSLLILFMMPLSLCHMLPAALSLFSLIHDAMIAIDYFRATR